MTATIKPPEKPRAKRQGLRLSSMEALGFADSESIWSDTTRLEPKAEPARRGRHEATVADLTPEDPGGRFTGSNVRWGLVVITFLLIGGLATLGIWLYQRPAAQEAASLATLNGRASALEAGLPALEAANDELLIGGITTGAPTLADLESAARALFAASAELNSSQTEIRTAASQASGSTLDGIRLANEARSYRAAVLPILAPPELETDPELIELDEAARQFGQWQLAFDNVRTALPDSVLSDVTQELDILSGDLSSILRRYVDALRQDDPAAVEAVVDDLADRLAALGETLDSELREIQTRIDTRVEEARVALGRLLND